MFFDKIQLIHIIKKGEHQKTFDILSRNKNQKSETLKRKFKKI